MAARFIEHKGVKVLLLDFAHLQDPTVLLGEIEEARQFVAQQPRRKEILTLVDLEEMNFNEDVLKALRALNVHNEPWEKAIAVTGFNMLGKITFRANQLPEDSRTRRIVAFDSKDDALEWLLKH
jgi:hypothetical protein